MADIELTIIVPIFNEARTITELVSKIENIKSVFKHCVFVDDGSTDESYLLLQEALHGREIHSTTLRQPNLGKGAAIRTGLKSVETSHVAVLDADLELDPTDLIELWRPIQNGETTASLGYRQFLSQSSYTYRYKVGNRILSHVYGLLFNQVISDVMCGYKVFPRDIFDGTKYKGRRFSIEIDILAALWRRKVQPYELQVSYKARSRSQGKIIGYSDALLVLLRMIYLRIVSRR